jgi:hypothetical protein
MYSEPLVVLLVLVGGDYLVLVLVLLIEVVIVLKVTVVKTC